MVAVVVVVVAIPGSVETAAAADAAEMQRAANKGGFQAAGRAVIA